MAEGIDFSWSRPGSAAIKAAGRSFVCRYVGPVRFGGKGMTQAEMQSYLNAGISVVLNFESSGQNTTSFANGVADAKYAQGEVAALGYPNAVIYFSNDKQDVTGLVDYFRGVESVIGHSRTGVYGGIGAIQILQGSGLASFYWQTYAWSGGRVAPGVHIYQYLNGQTVNGASVDFDRSLQDYFGQISSATPTGGGVQPFNPQENDMGTLDNTDANYQVFAQFLWRALKWDVRDGTTGAGADATHGATLWDRLGGIRSAIQPVTPDQVAAIATAIAAQVQVPTPVIDAAAIAKAVNDDAAKRLAG